ncbi:hypothetical protein RCL1_000836 [Eukaryota sp. TZLM3-RCL]
MQQSQSQDLLNNIKQSVLQVVDELNAKTQPSLQPSNAQHFKLLFMMPITTPSIVDFLLLKSNLDSARAFNVESESCAIVPLGFKLAEPLAVPTCPYVGYPSFLDLKVKKAMLSLLPAENFPFLLFFPNHSLLRQDPNNPAVGYSSILKELMMVKELVEVQKISIVIDGELSLVEALVICRMCQLIGIKSVQLGHAINNLSLPRSSIDILKEQFQELCFAIYMNECFLDFIDESGHGSYTTLVVPHSVPSVFPYSCRFLVSDIENSVVELLNSNNTSNRFFYIGCTRELKSPSRVSLSVLVVD